MKKTSQNGSALVYILIAIALLAALTATFMDSSSQQTSSQNSFNAVTELNSQANFIRSAIQECVLSYPAGDPGLINISVISKPYPLNPNSNTYLAAPVDSTNEVRNVRCPGNPTGAANNHTDIFSGASGKFMPAPPNLFEQWEYYNERDGVFFWTRTNKTDAFIQTALTKLDDQFSECEADVINASAGQIEMTSRAGGNDPKCQNGFYCFRVWLIANPSNVYLGDSDGDEADMDPVTAGAQPCP